MDIFFFCLILIGRLSTINCLNVIDQVELKAAGLRIVNKDDTLTIFSNGLPRTSKGKRYRHIREQNIRIRIPAYPTPISNDQKFCLPKGIIGIAIDGVPIYNPYTNDCCDAGYVEREYMDSCWGKRDESHHYYYNVPPLCAFEYMCNVSKIVGVALDGYPIYGPYDGAGRYITDLDECNGKYHLFGGYRYHLSETFPYMIGCFRGSPVLPTVCGCSGIKPSCINGTFHDYMNSTACCDKPIMNCSLYLNSYSNQAASSCTSIRSPELFYVISAILIFTLYS